MLTPHASPFGCAASPADADAYLVPAFGTNMAGLLEYYEHARGHVARAFPTQWARRRGADHVWLTSGDGGGCDLNRMAGVQTGHILAQYLMLNASEGKECGVAGKDVAMPPDVPAIAMDAAFLDAAVRPPSERPVTFFFAGNVPDRALVDTMSDLALAREAYSEGVRQLLWKHHRTRAGYKIVERSPSYRTDWSRSRFCSAPLGVGWGVRLAWAVGGGCVPLLASSHVSQWFDDALEYDAFSLRGVDKMRLPALPALLASVPAARLDSMHAALLAHRPFFRWVNGGLAYNMTLHELCWRSRHRRAGVDCTALLPASAQRLVLPPARRAPVPVPEQLRAIMRGARVGGGGKLGAAAWHWWRRERERST